MANNLIPKIPDDIYKNRCRYCIHFVAGKENREYKETQVLSARSPSPCKIASIAGYRYQISRGIGDYEYVAYTDGECRSFAPHQGFPGICESCEHFNHFAKETEYCKTEPKNRRPMLIGSVYGEVWKYAYHTCDKWLLDSFHRDRAIKNAAEGKIPATFDTETFMLIKPVDENAAAERWEIICREYAEKVKVEREAAAIKKATDKNGQFRLDL